jgi:tRNA-Thr(GGU) m(6)t(6)A37 methyltransferase TsaA
MTKQTKDNISFTMRPIGYIKCPGMKTIQTRHTKRKRATIEAEAVIKPILADALDEIETFDRVWLIWVFDKNIDAGYKTKVNPPVDPDNQHGLFVTRSPFRPNPIGLTCVKVIKRTKNILHFENHDIIDGTPLLDIKPYIPRSDSHPDARAGWLDMLKK